ncbi:hypothetical protein [Cellulophaga sp. Hel_I_12]|uniref:hypothetical protein n=1 Tax=Cellulophaga sp. Hel_I_12 TaxID=1249972 RepID=UPI000647093A|nr:hypothetical protein [Cellulophaga sp. Hel_I_12]
MKNIFKLTLILLLLVSCKDASNATDSKEAKIIESLINEVNGNHVPIDEKYTKLMKELKTKTLLSDDQLLEAYPKTMGSLSLDTNEARITSSETVIGSFGAGAIRMEILDAAAKNVMSAIIPLKMLELNKVMSENNNTIRYSKKERNGVLTFGTDRDASVGADYESEIRFLYDHRFYVTLEGKGMNVDELWDAIQLDDLKQFKKFNN